MFKIKSKCQDANQVIKTDGCFNACYQVPLSEMRKAKLLGKNILNKHDNEKLIIGKSQFIKIIYEQVNSH